MFFVFFSCCFHVSKKNKNEIGGVSGWGLINPGFSRIFGFFNLTRPLTGNEMSV